MLFHARPLVRWLLDWCADRVPSPSGTDLGTLTGTERERELRWVLAGGLGPLLHRVLADAGGAEVPETWRDALRSADLTARVRHARLVAVATEVLAACTSLGVIPVLLKGISTSDELYPEGHLRPMGDVDILLPREAYPRVESALLERGYLLTGEAAEHHGPPLRHAHEAVWIELHTELFPGTWRLRLGNTFAIPGVWSEVRPSTFRGMPVARLSPELQVPYAASSLMANLMGYNVHPSFLSTLLDVVLLLRAKGDALDWDRMLAGLDNPLARASTFVTLKYLEERGLATIPRDVLSRMRKGQDVMGPIQAACIRVLLARYLVGGRAWNFPIPPPVPLRYNLRYQFDKRVLRKRINLLERS